MQVVLMERIEKLGIMGDIVTVKDGFARNYLLPQGKALRATKENIEGFELQRAQLEANNLERRKDAEAVAERMDGVSVVIVRQASETDQLYGSVSFRDIAEALCDAGYAIDRRQVSLDRPIKTIGLFPVKVVLHPEVSITVRVNVARSEEEAEAAETLDEEQVLAEAQSVFESEELAQEATETLVESEEEEAEEAAADDSAEEDAATEEAAEETSDEDPEKD